MKLYDIVIYNIALKTGCFPRTPWGLSIVHLGDGLWEKAAPMPGCFGAKSSEEGQQVEELISWVGGVGVQTIQFNC